MAQDQDLHILRSGTPGKQPKPAEHRDRDQIQQSKQHNQRSWPDRGYRGKLQVTTQTASFGTVQATRRGLYNVGTAVACGRTRYRFLRTITVDELSTSPPTMYGVQFCPKPPMA